MSGPKTKCTIEHFLAKLTLLLASLVFPGTGAHAVTPLRVGVQAIPATMGNPYRNTFTPNIYTMGATFDGLTRIDEYGQLQPWLATRWENTGPLTWVFHLRKGVRFSNGVSFTAEAVVNAVNYLRSEDAVREMIARELDFIERARVLDEQTVELTTNRPAPFLPRYLSILYMVEPGEWQRLGPAEFSRRPVGTGPFVMNAFKPAKIELTAFEDSWRKPNVERLEILAIPEAVSRTQAVQSGLLDVAIGIGPEEVAAIESSGGAGMSWLAGSLWAINFVDKAGSPFKDRRVRQAVNYAVDRDLIIEALLDGVPVPATQPAPRVALGHNPDLPPIPYEPDTARELLAEAGYADGFKFVLQGTVGTGAADAAVYQVVAQQLAAVGIDMEIHPVTVAKLISNVIQGGWEGEAFGLNYNHEPSVDSIRGLTNHSCLWHHPWYCDVRIMPTIEQALVEFDPQRALALRHEIMAFYRREYASLFLYEYAYFAGTSARVSGVKIVHGFVHFEAMSLDE
jgi:peptide/nickel transport system substrate-binding protein